MQVAASLHPPVAAAAAQPTTPPSVDPTAALDAEMKRELAEEQEAGAEDETASNDPRTSSPQDDLPPAVDSTNFASPDPDVDFAHVAPSVTGRDAAADDSADTPPTDQADAISSRGRVPPSGNADTADAQLSEVARLEAEKKAAVEREDFVEAERLKKELEKAKVQAAQEAATAVSVDGEAAREDEVKQLRMENKRLWKSIGKLWAEKGLKRRQDPHLVVTVGDPGEPPRFGAMAHRSTPVEDDAATITLPSEDDSDAERVQQAAPPPQAPGRLSSRALRRMTLEMAARPLAQWELEEIVGGAPAEDPRRAARARGARGARARRRRDDADRYRMRQVAAASLGAHGRVAGAWRRFWGDIGAVGAVTDAAERSSPTQGQRSWRRRPQMLLSSLFADMERSEDAV